MTERDEDGFLDRWSRRKRGEASPGAPETETAEAAQPAAKPAEPSGGRSGPPPARARPTAAGPLQSEDAPDSGDPEVVAKLPDLDTLKEDSDFTVFLQDGVPDALRRQALRRLWRTNPVLANLDGLNDYDEDYTVSEPLVKALKTVYEAGKGDLDEDETAAPEGEAGKGDLDEDETAAPEGEAAEAEAGEMPAAAEASQDRERDSERAAEADHPAQPPPSTESPAPGPAAAAAEEIPKPVRGSARKRRWGALDS